MFGAPLRAPGTGPKPTDGFLGFLGEAKTTIVSGTCMFLFIMGAWLFGLVQIPLPGLVMLLLAVILHSSVAIHVSKNIDKTPDAATRFDAKRVATDVKKKRAKKDT